MSPSPGARHLTLLLVLVLGACSTPRIDLAGWRARTTRERPVAERRELAADRAEVEQLRSADELARARELALALAAEHPNEGAVLTLASRAESDGVFLFPEKDTDARNHAAASALDFAERAWEFGERSVPARAQLAWALGTTTHLQPMSARSEHARRILAVATAVRAEEPENATALATLAVLNLRLETLPWIAKLMASGLPESSLAVAEDCARRAVAAAPSRENRMILAKVLIAAEREKEALTVVEEALAAPPAYPRDHALEPAVRALLAKLGGAR
ncbi:MAG: hypothetical protein HZA53_10150 [Planctomycetes bacterium]|nr:hypothetical protein [Planctomycetota bacterium]